MRRQDRRYALAPVLAFLSILFVTLTFGLTFAHVLEIPGKLRLDASHWLVVQQNLYVGFGVVGGACEVLAVAFTWTAIRLWQPGSALRRCAWTAALLTSMGLLVWAAVVSPMNIVLNGWTPASVPMEWTHVRNRWEIGHAVHAALFAGAFVALVIGQIVRMPGDNR